MFGFTAPSTAQPAAAASGTTASPAAPPSAFSLGAPSSAAAAPAAPTAAAGGFGATTPAASQPGRGTAVPAATTPAAATPAPATAKPTATEPPAPTSYATLFEKACRDGVVSDAFAQAIKKCFGAPMEVKLPFTNATSATVQQVGTQFKSALAPQTSLAGTTLSGAGIVNAPNPSPLARNTEVQQQQQQHRQLQTENAHNLLQLLLMCDSGYNNSEISPADNAASSHRSEVGEEAVKGLHATVGAIAASAASNLIAFVKATVVRHTQALDGESSAATSLLGDTRRKRTSDDPTLLAVQCLYLLSRHFQLTASVVKEALDLIDVLYFLLKNSLRSRLIPLSTFSESSDTCALNTVTWLCVFSVVNMVAVWKKLRSTTGELRLNELIQSNVASSIEAAVSSQRKRLRESVQSTDAGAGGSELRGGSSTAAAVARASAASLVLPAVYTWQVVVDSYLGILSLAEGCLLRAKGSEQGFDRALDAFLGERVTAGVAVLATSSAPPSSAATPGVAASMAVHRGKVTKRMVELAPVPRTLAVPVALLYIAPYEMMSYLFDEMLPLLRHLSELEVATHRRYIEQLEEVPRISSVAQGGQSTFQQRTFPGLQSGNINADGEDGWLRRMTRMGLHGEVVGEPFTSEMAHLLEALAICLQHLPPEVLNPDLDADCAATFFIFKNFVKHMRQVFATQRSGASSSDASISSPSAVWENYTLKLMTKFLEVLAMIGRNPQYTQRIVVLLTDAQTECGELQWQSLVNQALECAGFNSGVLSMLDMSSGGSGMSPSAMITAAVAQSSSSSSSPSALLNGRGAASGDVYAASSAMVPCNGIPRSLHRQFTRPYARKCQRQFISSFFLLLRQLFAHPTLRATVSAYIRLELALVFLFAPQQSQSMLGSTLSLVSALITNASDAQLVWTFLEQLHLLQLPSTRTQRGSLNPIDKIAASYDRYSAGDSGSSSAAAGGAASREPATHEETLSLMGHCQYECTQGTYNITIGFLNLITALFQNDQPTMAALGVYTTVTNFISHEIIRGVLKRVFVFQHERYTVFALAAAALRQALQVRFHGENGRSTALPFANVMAINKAPADVVGEVVKLVFEASDAPYELLSHHRAAVRQGLRLLITAIQTVHDQKIELLLFDTRTTLNTDLAVRILSLCSLQDTLLTKSTLQLLLLFPAETANQAAHYWSGLTTKYAPVLESFAQLLHPLSAVPVVVQAPPELAQHDFDPAELVPGWSSALLTDTKSLLLDLLMRHADVTEPSLTAWMCGFYHEEYAARDRRGRVSTTVGSRAYNSGGNTDSSGGETRWWRSTLLTSVVEGACSSEVERAHPALAVKCVKLLYLLRANRLYGTCVVRPFLDSVCQTLFLHLQHFRASQCTPVALSKYAYVLKLLALEVCYAYRTSPDDLRLAHNTSIPSISVEVLLSLLYPFGAAVEGGHAHLAGSATPASRAVVGTSTFVADSFLEGGADRSVGGHLDGNNDGTDDAHICGAAVRMNPSPGTATIVSRDAAVDITSWLPQALQVLPAFPEKLPPISGGRGHLVPCAADGVVQYNVATLYEALQLEQVRASKPPLTMAELREKLRPFIAANDCFFSYAAGVSFVEGWCQLVSVSCSVVQGLPLSRLRAFALCILRGLDATTSMTAAAQEQVCTRLCHCLSTVMAHLRKATLATVAHTAIAQWSTVNRDGGARRSGLSNADDGDLHFRSMETGLGKQQHPGLEASAVSGRLVPDTPMSAIGKRRFRDDTAVSMGIRQRDNEQGVAGRSSSNPFATRVGEADNLYSTKRRSQLAQALLQRRQAERLVAADDVAANAAVLQPLVHAIVQWGTHIASIRTDLYMSLLCLAETPGINLDDVVLWRSQKTLLNVICADICSGCASNSTTPAATAAGGAAAAAAAASTAVAAMSRSAVALGLATSSIREVGTAATGILAPQVQHAVALLVALLQASTPIRDDFCNPNAGSGDGMGTWALRCATALLQSVDNAVYAFFANASVPIGSLLWHIRNTFDLLSVVSLGHASQVLHSDLLRLCFAMQSWKCSTQVVLGYSQAPITHEQIVNRSLVEQNKEVLRRLLLGTVRWVNLLLSFLGDATPLLYEVQKFVRDNRSLIDYVFISPTAVSSTLPGSSRLSGSHLTLCAELSECLRALSSSMLAVDCRMLVDSMALPDLLNTLSSEEMWLRGPADQYDFTDMDSVGGTAADVSSYSGEPTAAAVAAAAAAQYDAAAASVDVGLGGGALVKQVSGSAAALTMAERGRDVVALTVRNLAHLLLNSEYGLRGTEVELVGNESSRSANSTPMLRFFPGKRSLCVQTVSRVAHSLTDIARANAHEFRLECYLYALHALVCLLHSFVLPLAQGAPQQQAPADFMRYLKELPLQDLVEVLTQAHDAVYCLKRYNTDYRGGLRAHRLDARHPWTTEADAGESAENDDAATQSLSNAMQRFSPDGDTPHSPHPLSTPKSGPALNSTEPFSVPSTPGLLPTNADGRHGGRDVAVPHAGQPQGSTGAMKMFAPVESTHQRHGSPSAGRVLPVTEAAGAAAAGLVRDPNSTVVQSYVGSQARGVPAFALSTDAEANLGLNGEATSMLPMTAEGDKLRPDSTLWELLPQRNDRECEWTRVYDSFQNGGTLNSDLGLTVNRDAAQQWANVLNVENEVRQIKVAIANALRATRGAISAVRKMQ
jgi:hypothetical protein